MKEFHTKPDINDTKEASSFVDDHLGKSHAMVSTWGNGEGFSIEVQDTDEDGKTTAKEQIDLTWSQWDAVKACVKAVRK